MVRLLRVYVMANVAIAPQEDLILRLLESGDVTPTKELGSYRVKGTQDRCVVRDGGDLLSFDVMRPRRIFTFDAADESRLFPSSHSDLMAHPSDILGEETESGVICGERMNWSGFRRIKGRPKRVCAARSGDHIYYERHCRVVGKSSGYFKRLVAFDAKGSPVPLFINGIPIGQPGDGVAAILTCGLVEDAFRRDAYLCSLSDAVDLLFPLSAADVFDFFASREAPMTPGGRRRALIHWVSEHMRKVSLAKKTVIRQHYRGITEFTVDGLSVSAIPNNRTAAEPK